MKNIFFALIMATSTALFALPSDSSMAIAQSDLKENVQAARVSKNRHRNNNGQNGQNGGNWDNKGKDGDKWDHKCDQKCEFDCHRRCVPSTICSYGSFFLSESSAAGTVIATDAVIPLSESTTHTADVKLISNGVIQIDTPGDYHVVFGSLNGTVTGSPSVNGSVGLFLNKIGALAGTNLPLPDSNIPGLQGIISAATIISVPKGGSTLSLNNTSGTSLTLNETSSGNVAAYITLFRVNATFAP